MDEPPTGPLDWYYTKAFWDLNTTRNYEMGPIPWNKIIEYADIEGLDQDNTQAFVVIIRTMDAKLLTWEAEEVKKRTSKNA